MQVDQVESYRTGLRRLAKHMRAGGTYKQSQMATLDEVLAKLERDSRRLRKAIAEAGES